MTRHITIRSLDQHGLSLSIHLNVPLTVEFYYLFFQIRQKCPWLRNVDFRLSDSNFHYVSIDQLISSNDSSYFSVILPTSGGMIHPDDVFPDQLPESRLPESGQTEDIVQHPSQINIEVVDVGKEKRSSSLDF